MIDKEDLKQAMIDNSRDINNSLFSEKKVIDLKVVLKIIDFHFKGEPDEDIRKPYKD